MKLMFKSKELHARKIGSDKESEFIVDTDSLTVFADGVSLSIDDGWAVYKGRGFNKKQVGTEFVVRDMQLDEGKYKFSKIRWRLRRPLKKVE